MMGHPGKKLLFMGQDFAQLSEWSEKKSLDWHLLNEPQHKAMQEYVRALLGIYGRYKACSELDQYPEGFEWINPNDADRSIYSFIRKSPSGRDSLLFVCNFTPVERADYRVGVPCRGKYTLLLNEKCGSGEIYDAVKSECDGREYSIGFKLPAYGTAIIKFNMKK